MSENDVKPGEIEGAEVDPLTDEDLDSVAGGKESVRSDCSCTNTTGSCTGSTDPTLDA